MADADVNNDHKCDKRCFMCDRPSDVFRHVHLAPDHTGPPPAAGEAAEGRELVLCVPCLASLSSHLSQALLAYLNGGHLFDRYARRRARRHRDRSGESTPLPKYVLDVLEDMARDGGSDADMASSDG